MSPALLVSFLAVLPLVAATLQQSESSPEAPRQEAPRAWLGVYVGGEGTVDVTGVQRDSPAARVHLRAGDQIVALDGKPLASYDDLVAEIGKRAVGREVELLIRRDVEIALDDAYKQGERHLLGVELDESKSGAGGVRLQSVQRGMPAARAGLATGDRIVSIDGAAIESGDQLRERLTNLGEPRVRARIERTIKVALGERPAQPAAPAPAPAEPRNPFDRTLRDEFERGRSVAPSTAQPRSRLYREDPELQRELRALVDDIRRLREEIAQLRAEVERLRRVR
jgi:S1-C subfamily serine protease